MDYTEFYFINKVGYYPFATDKERRITEATIQYLIDSGLKDSEIIKAIESSLGDYLSPENLPEDLWLNSLTARGEYYYSKELQLIPPAPTFDLLNHKESYEPFYIEIKPSYTYLDLIDYFYNNLSGQEFKDIKRDTGAFAHLISKYSKIHQAIQGLDFVLALIASARDDENRPEHLSILQLSNYQSDTLEKMKTIVDESKLCGSNKIIWRSHQWMDT